MGLGLGLGIQFLSSLGGALSKFLTWGKSSPARFWGTTTPEIWGVTESAGIVVNQFKNRVIADGGIFEAQSCMTAQIQSLFDIQSNIPIGIDVQAQAHYNRVIADGGVVPAGFDGVNSFFRLVKSVYNTTDINTAISAAYDPHYLGYKLGAGSGTTLGQAAQTLYSVKSTENLLFPSEDFASAAWLKTGVTITSNSIIAPDGALTADTFNGAAASFISNNFLALTPQSYTTSIYVKKFITSSISIEFQYHQSGSNNTLVTFNFDTGVISGGTVETLANGWFRIRAITNITANRNQLRIVSADSFYIWGAQLNTGLVALPYTPTTTTAQTLADVTQTTAASQPLLLAHTGTNYYFNDDTGASSISKSISNISTGTNYVFEFGLDSAFTSGNIRTIAGHGTSNGSSIWIRWALNTLVFDYRNPRVEVSSNTLNANSRFFKIEFTKNSGTSYTITFSEKINIGDSYTINRTATVTGTTTTIGTIDTAWMGSLGSSFGLLGKLLFVNCTVDGLPIYNFQASNYVASTSQTTLPDSVLGTWTINTDTATTGYKGVLVDRTIVQGDGVDDGLAPTSNILPFVNGTTYRSWRIFETTRSNTSIVSLGNNPNEIDNKNTNNTINNVAMFVPSLNLRFAAMQRNESALQGIANVNNGATITNTISALGTNLNRIYLFQNIFSQNGNGIVNTAIVTSLLDNATTRTAMYDVIRRFNNNAF